MARIQVTDGPLYDGKPQITAALIVKNEAANLPRCLTALSHLDDIVVVDTGSEDESLSVARSLGARITTFPWTNDFAEARNAALAMVKTDWVLSIDADEELFATKDQLQAAIKDVDQVAIGIHDAYQPNKPSAVRLWRMVPGIHWVRPIHEQMVQPGIEPKIRDASAKIHLVHYGYAPELNQAKAERNLGLLRIHAAKDPEDGLTHLLWARECAYLGHREEGLESAIRAIDTCEGDELSDAYAVAAWICIDQEDWTQAEEITKEARQRDSATPLTEYMRAIAWLKLGNRVKAAEACSRSLHLPDPVSLLGLGHVLSVKRHQLARELAGSNSLPKVEAYRVLRDRPL